MKRLITSLLAVVLVVSLLSAVVLAENYTTTKYKDASFFMSMQWGGVPPYEDSYVFSPASYYYFPLSGNSDCRAGVEMTAELGSLSAEVYGDNNRYGSPEIYEHVVDSVDMDELNSLGIAEAVCPNSIYALSMHFEAHECDASWNELNMYCLNIYSN